MNISIYLFDLNRYDQEFLFILEEKIDGVAFHALSKDDIASFGVTTFGDVHKLIRLQRSKLVEKPQREIPLYLNLLLLIIVFDIL